MSKRTFYVIRSAAANWYMGDTPANTHNVEEALQYPCAMDAIKAYGDRCEESRSGTPATPLLVRVDVVDAAPIVPPPTYTETVLS